jgi:hypothetical protein
VSPKHVIDELSAYIDGESRRPEDVRRHLQVCESCARRHIELLKLSATLHEMESPVANPEFTRNVLARITAETAATGTRWRTPFLTPRFAWAMAAAFLIVFSGMAVWFALGPSPETRLVQQCRAWNDDETIIAQFEKLIIEGVDPGALLFVSPEGEIDMEITFDDIAEVLALAIEEDLTGMDEGTELFDSGDIYFGIEALDSQTEAVLRELLNEYLAQTVKKG